MRRWLLLAGVLAFAPAAARAAANDDTTAIDRLSWMSGSWASDSAGVRIEEHWMAPRGGMMVGMHRDVIQERAVSFEFFRIETDSAGLVYQTSPRGRLATPFRMKEAGAHRVVFENLAHDFPQRILYWLDAQGRLNARIEGTLRGKPESESWRWKRDALAPGASRSK